MSLTIPIDLTYPVGDEDVDTLSAALDGTGVRFEIDNGRLLLMSPVKAWHWDVAHRIGNILRGRGLRVYGEQGIKLSRGNLRVPDISVFHVDPDLRADRHDPELIALAVEVISPGSEDDDRIVKPRLYARAGIQEYWVADTHPGDPRDALVDRFVLDGSGDGARYVQRDQVSLTALEVTPGL